MADLFKGLEVFGIIGTSELDLYKKDDEKKETVKEVKEVKPEDYLFKRKLVCPICETEFENSSMRTLKSKYIKSDTDLKAYYEPYDPLYYDFAVCAKCGYAAMTTVFNSITEKQADLIKTNITPFYKGRNYPLVHTLDQAIERAKLSLYCTAVKNGKNGEKAMNCLKLAWLMREKRDSDSELLYIKNALDGFLIAYENESFPIFGMDDSTMCYLISDLSRRLKRYDEAGRFLSRVVTSYSASKRLKDKAIDLRDIMRLEMQEMKSVASPPASSENGKKEAKVQEKRKFFGRK